MTRFTLLILPVPCLLVLCLLAGCNAERGSAGTGSTDAPMPLQEASADTIRVRGVGYVPKVEAYERFMRGRVPYPQVPEYVEALAKTGEPSVVDSLLLYYERNDHNTHVTVFATAVEMKSPTFVQWLQEHTDQLDANEWGLIAAAVQRAQWRDSTVVALLMEEALHGEDVSTRAPTVRAFNGIGTLSELRTIAVLADTTVSRSIEERALAALTRFDVPEFNRRVRSDLQSADELSSNIEHSIERHGRYDFLPVLRDVASRLGPTMSEYDRKELEGIVAELEQKKADGAPLGVPLDWPRATGGEVEREGSDKEAD